MTGRCLYFTAVFVLELIDIAAHQIRVHLQYLGYPVANDPIYSEIRIWASPQFLCACSAKTDMHIRRGNNSAGEVSIRVPA